MAIYDINLDRSYSFVNLDRPDYAQNVPWNSPLYFQTLLIFYLIIFVLLAVFEFGFYVIDWCRPCGGKHEDDWRIIAGHMHPIFSICAK